jgi:hypothetical protein
MSTLVPVPLGDGSFLDLGYTSPNSHGIDISFFTDPTTGADPFRSAIPNPPLVFAWPDNWGAAPDLLPYVPAKPIAVVIQPTPDDPVVTPEPLSAALVGIVLVVGIALRRFRR